MGNVCEVNKTCSDLQVFLKGLRNFYSNYILWGSPSYTTDKCTAINEAPGREEIQKQIEEIQKQIWKTL